VFGADNDDVEDMRGGESSPVCCCSLKTITIQKKNSPVVAHTINRRKFRNRRWISDDTDDGTLRLRLRIATILLAGWSNYYIKIYVSRVECGGDNNIMYAYNCIIADIADIPDFHRRLT
jgi:hypothetical protein